MREEDLGDRTLSVESKLLFDDRKLLMFYQDTLRLQSEKTAC